MLVEIELDDGRGPVVVKRPTTAGDRADLRREAAALTAARHPGVVALVDRGSDGGGDGADLDRPLRLRWVGPHSLATTAPFAPGEAASIVAALAETVADLHDRGLVHTRIRPEHVVLAADGRPVLCGLREAAPAREQPPSSDVAALGQLLVHLLGPDGGAELEPIPDRRRPFGRAPWHGYQRRALLVLADQADADNPAQRPTARAFATSLRAMAGGPSRFSVRRGGTTPPPAPIRHAARPPARPTPPAAEPAPRAPSHRPSPSRRLTAVATGLGALVVVFGVAQVVRSPSAGTPRSAPVDRSAVTSAAPRPSAKPSTPASTPPSTPPPTTVAVAPATTAGLPVRTCADPGGSTVDVDGDGCPDRIAVEAGAVVVAGVRYELGQPGDQILIADWRCSGRATPALLRPTTGEVFVFPGWATADHPVTIRPTQVVPGARSIRAGADGRRGCPVLEVERDALPAVSIALEER